MTLRFKEAQVKGRVSVVMACYNAEHFLAEAVESALGQTYSDVELVVVDDGSTDSTLAILRRYGDKLRVLHQAHSGPGAARNAGMDACTGEFVSFLDADDYWEPCCIERLLDGLQRAHDTALSYCGWQNVGPGARRQGPFVPPEYENDHKMEALLRNAALWPIHGALIRRSALEEVGGFNTCWERCEDYDLWLRLASTRRITRVPQVMAYYRHYRDLKDTDRRGADAEVLWRIKAAFLEDFPEAVEGMSKVALRNCLEGGLRRRGVQCFQNGEYLSARRIFRRLLETGSFGPRDLKYLLPSLLPMQIYLAAMARRRNSGNKS